MGLSSGLEGAKLYLQLSNKGLAKMAPSGAAEKMQQKISIEPIPTVIERSGNDDRKEKKESAGPAWFNMEAGQVTREVKRDLDVLRLRGSIDPKRFYKKTEPVGKFFQVGTVLDSPHDFYSARLVKKERKQTIFESLMKDTQKTKYLKRKFNEIQQKNQRSGRKPKFARK